MCRAAYVLSRLYSEPPMCRSRLCAEPLMRRAAYMRAAYALSPVCIEPAHVLSRLAAVYLRSAVRGTPMCGGRYMLGRL